MLFNVSFGEAEAAAMSEKRPQTNNVAAPSQGSRHVGKTAITRHQWLSSDPDLVAAPFLACGEGVTKRHRVGEDRAR